jgi:hypothetical protein
MSGRIRPPLYLILRLVPLDSGKFSIRLGEGREIVCFKATSTTRPYRRPRRYRARLQLGGAGRAATGVRTWGRAAGHASTGLKHFSAVHISA